MKTIKFTPERVSAYCKASKEYISELTLSLGEDGNDYITNTLTAKLDALILSHTVDEKVLTYYCPRPTFMDWILRRERKVEWKITAKDLFKNPPTVNTTRIYIDELQ